MAIQVVIDTNVVLAATRSRIGASFAVLELLGRGKYESHLSVSLVTEYRDVLARFAGPDTYDIAEAEKVVDDLCGASHLHGIYYLWRPYLADPKDDLLLELAAGARADFIVTHNVRHFQNLAQFGIDVATPLQFLKLVGGVE